MAVSTVTEESMPTYTDTPTELGDQLFPERTTFSGSTGGSVNVTNNTMEFWPDCNVHHQPDEHLAFPALGTATTSDILNHQDINSLKYAINSLVTNWSQGNDKVYASRISFDDAVVAGQYKKTEWDQIVGTLEQFGFTIVKPATLLASFHNELKDKYEIYTHNCLCNSDCDCNMVCVCNTDCGCNY